MERQEYSQPNSPADFVRQLMQSQSQIYAFILTLAPNWSDAEDILQETAQILWQKYGQTQQIVNFTGLGIRVAQNVVYSYYRRKKQHEQFLDKTAFEDIAHYAGQFCDNADNHVRILQHCLSKLPVRDMELIRLHYEEGLTIKKIAEVLSRSATGLYKVMGRIHEVIMQCIKRGLVMENSNE